MLLPYGIIPALITPFNDKEEVNETALRGIVQRMIGAGVHGLFGCGANIKKDQSLSLF